MAKQGRRVLPARKKDRDDDSLLVRSAESLGRVIGSLQRQLQDTSKRASSLADDALTAMPKLPRAGDVLGTTERPSRKRASTRRSGSRKPKQAARPRSSSRKRTAARKSSKKR